MGTTTTDSDWHANKSDYDEYRTLDGVSTKAGIHAKLVRFVAEYSHVVVVAKYHKHGGHYNREVDPDALEYDPDSNSLDIYGRPATGRYVRPDTFEAVKLWK